MYNHFKTTQQMKTANEIYNLHLEAFKAGLIQVNTSSPKFKTANEVRDYLLNGGVIPALFIRTSEVMSVTEQVFMFSILSFSSDRMELKFKRAFIGAIGRLSIS